MSQYFDVSGVNLISAGGGRLYKNKTALKLSVSGVEFISEGINNETYVSISNIGKTTLEIGKDASGKSINGHIKSLFYYPEDLTSENLKALSTRRETTSMPPANEPNFTMAVLITSPNTTWNLRSTGTVNYDVDWGDGQKEILQTSNTKAHTYASPGIYKVVVKIRSGVWRPFYNNNVDAERIVSIFPTGTDWTFGTNLASAFYRAVNLVNMENIYTSNVTDMSNAWRDCRSLLSFPLLDTPSVTTVAQAWTGCSKLTSFPLINTAAVTNFSSAWQNCAGLTSFPLINTSVGTNFGSTWFGCSGLTNFPLINIPSAITLQNAWSNCTNLTSFPSINTSSVSDFSFAWRSCTSLTNFPSINTSNGSNFTSAWISCTSLTSFPLINTAAGTTFNSAWQNCTSLSTFPANMFNTTGTLVATAFTNAFFNCALTATSIENILTSLVTNGQSNITLSLSGGTNAAKSTWTTAANTAYDTLISRGWTITFIA